ncbi:DUF4391 domain-containing protein [Erysipelothrix rhusiopathiae]|uniref:DUF4391 domain-containing protein n=1 Tax=Erysipelothrix rhusiopathiae TaxID=1648 RepID=UPI000CA1CC98|nr:DUF4391 domain-containing protein [Erysipelothrix rhusiopathiae]ASD51135.1 methyl-accepting chemotaxis protein [Erysipelothrix phage phi1605]QDS38478.1 DUF4391 domain-containing protein [Erysipelothrix rhusiopathiae]
METRDLLKWWKFPKNTIVNRNLPKSQIYLHMKNSNDKAYLQEYVQSIYLLANFKTDNTRIPAFESETETYQEVQFIYLKIRENGNASKLYKLLASLIPYPLVVIIEQEKGFVIYTGRFEKMTTGYIRLLSVYDSPLLAEDELKETLNQLSILVLPNQNLKVFYDSLRDTLVNLQIKKEYSTFSGIMDCTQKDRIDEINGEIAKMKNAIKKEKQINRKVEYQVKLRKLKQELNDILGV